MHTMEIGPFPPGQSYPWTSHLKVFTYTLPSACVAHHALTTLCPHGQILPILRPCFSALCPITLSWSFPSPSWSHLSFPWAAEQPGSCLVQPSLTAPGQCTVRPAFWAVPSAPPLHLWPGSSPREPEAQVAAPVLSKICMGGPAARHSKASKQARLVERKICFISDARHWGGRVAGTCPEAR